MNYEYFSTASDSPAITGVAIVFLIIYFLFVLGFYIYFALALQKIAKRLGSEYGWWAWIPILNMLLMFELAKKPMWWILGLFIPGINIVVGILVWYYIIERLQKPTWYVVLFFIPLANIIVLGMLAWGSSQAAVVAPSQEGASGAGVTPQADPGPTPTGAKSLMPEEQKSEQPQQNQGDNQ